MADASLETAERELIQMYAEWSAALERGDRGWFERTELDDFIYIDIEGTERSKAQHIEMDLSVTDSEVALHSFRVRLKGSTAIVTAAYFARCKPSPDVVTPTLKAAYEQGQEMVFTAVWIRRPDGWKVASHQATRVGPVTP